MRSFEESKSPELLSRQSTDFLNLRTVEFRTARHSDRDDSNEIQSPQYYADLLKTLQTPQQYSVVRQALKSSQNEWMRDFVSHNGFNNLLHTLSLVCCPKSPPNDRILSALVACVSAVLERRDGLEAATKGEDTVSRLAMGLVCSDEVVKKDILSLLTSLARHSSTGHRRVLDAFTQLKKLQHLSHRFILLVQDLTSSDSTEYHQTLLTCLNCLIDRSVTIEQRTDIRNEFIALGLLEVLKRLRNSPNTGVAQQIIRFYDQKSSDDVTSSDGLDVSDPQAMFTILWKQIATTPQSTDLVRILQKLLLTVDDGSDSWGKAEHALTGPRSTEGVFDEREEEREEEQRESSPDVPECPVPQRLYWQTVPDNKSMLRSVWSRVSECKANQGISNLGTYFYRTHPATNKLLFIASERANRLKLLLATFSGPGVDSIERFIQYITHGDVEGLGEGVLRLLIHHLPKDPTVIKTIQQYDGDEEDLDDAEKLCFALFNLPGNKARLQCMLGSVELPRLIERLRGVIDRYRSLADTLTKEDCPLNELLRLVLDVGNVLNAESPPSKGYKLGALCQLYDMRAPRQPSLTLLRYITQILDRAQPDVLEFVKILSDQLDLCIKDDLSEVEQCLKEAEVSLRGVRTSLVASNKELKLQFTEFVVEAGKKLTELKSSREELKKRVEELALYYCESPDSFDVTQFYTSLHSFTQQVVETHELCKLSTLSCHSPDTPPKQQSPPAPAPDAVFHEYSPAPISAGISETSEDSFTFGDRMSIEAHLKTIESPPPVAPNLAKRKSFDMQLSYTQRHGTDFQRLHDNFRSVDHGCRSAYETPRPYANQSITHEMTARPLPPPPDIIPRHQATVFEPVPVLFEGPPKGRFGKDLRHSPPTRDDDVRDNVQPVGYQSDSDTSDESELEDEYGEAYRDCYYDFPKPSPRGETRSETRSMGYSSVNVTLNDPMGNIGGSLRSHQRPPRVDVRDIFNTPRVDVRDIFNRAHSMSTNDMRTQDQRQRDLRNAHTELQRNAQHHSIQSMIQRDQNSALTSQRLGGTKRENSRSTPSLSIQQQASSMSSQQQARNGHTMSNPVNNTSLSPPVALRYQAQTRGGLDRPYSAGSRGGAKLPPFIDETEIIHHERQTSEPTEMRRGGLVRAGKFSSSSSEINKSGVETEV